MQPAASSFVIDSTALARYLEYLAGQPLAPREAYSAHVSGRLGYVDWLAGRTGG